MFFGFLPAHPVYPCEFLIRILGHFLVFAAAEDVQVIGDFVEGVRDLAYHGGMITEPAAAAAQGQLGMGAPVFGHRAVAFLIRYIPVSKA